MTKGPTSHDANVPRGERILRLALVIPATVMLLAMMIYTVANALSRTLFKSPLPAAIEITQYWFLPVLACLGFVAAQLVHQHVDADLFYGRFPPAGKKWLSVGIDILSVSILLAGVYFTLTEALYAMEKNLRSGYTNIPAWPVYFLVPLSFLGMAVLFAIDCLRSLRRKPEDFARDDSVTSLTADSQGGR